MVSGRANIIGPFDAKLAATQDAIDQARRFEQSAKDELEQHRRWLNSYIATESRDRAKHERRLWLMEVVPRRRLKRQLILRRAKRATWKFLRRVRAVSLLVWRDAVIVSRQLWQWLAVGTTWSLRRLRVAARALVAFSAASYAWTKHNVAAPLGRLLAAGWAMARAKGLSFARWLFTVCSAGLAWTGRQATVFGRRLAVLLSATYAWSLIQGRAIGLRLASLAERGAALTKREAKGLARSAARQVSVGSAWAAKSAHATALRLRVTAGAAYAKGVSRARRFVKELPARTAYGWRLAQRHGREVLTLAGTIYARTDARIQDLTRQLGAKLTTGERVAAYSALPPQRALVPLRQQSRALVPATPAPASAAMAGPARTVTKGKPKTRPRPKKNRPVGKAGTRKRRPPRKRKSA